MFEQGKERLEESEVYQGFEDLVASEKYTFELVLQSLTVRQTGLLRAVARQSTASIYAAPYMARHGLGSVGGVQGALKVLVSLDLVEQGEDKVWRLVDPVFEEWLRRLD